MAADSFRTLKRMTCIAQAGLSVLKIPAAVLAMTILTWMPIRGYWGELYAAGTVPYYYAGSMGLLRPAAHGPIQLMVLAIAAFLSRRRLLRVPALVLAAACAAIWPTARWIDALGWACFQDGSTGMADLLWELGPHVASIGLLLLTCAASAAPRQAAAADGPSGHR